MGSPQEPDAQESCAQKLLIRQLNDQFRVSFAGGLVVLTRRVSALPPGEVAKILRAVRSYGDFSQDSDPHGEHDFGGIPWGRDRLLWKIDYYDEALEYGSPDPANPAVTRRVLTVMFSEEY